MGGWVSNGLRKNNGEYNELYRVDTPLRSLKTDNFIKKV